MNILHYLKNAGKYIYEFGSVNPFDKLVESTAHEHILIVPNSMVVYKKDFRKLFTKYHIAALFELSNCFLGSHNEPYMFLFVVDKPVTTVKIASYYKSSHAFRDDIDTVDYSKKWLPKQYTDDFQDYLDNLGDWMESGKIPHSKEEITEYRVINPDEVFQEFIYARFYQSQNDKVRCMLQNETTHPLSAIAEIIDVSYVLDKPVEVRSLDPNHIPTYPYFPEKDTVRNIATTEILHKNDIVAYKKSFFLVDKEAEFDVYAPAGSHVIRSHSLTPEYLYLYLISATAARIRYAFDVHCGDFISASLGDLRNFPIILPKEDTQFYKDQFAKLAQPERIYVRLEELPQGNTFDAELRRECIDRLVSKNYTLLKTLIENDFTELKICYEHKAYKAAIILAGSLLEAFVIDWMSEIDGNDYFHNELMVIGRDGRKKKADLLDYIDELRGRLGVTWDSEKTDAHQIRMKRNNIHVKVSLKYPTNISESSCRQTIQELERIIKSRNIGLLS